MTEYISTLQEIKQLPPELHLLCPRQADDDNDRYDEDVEGEDIPEISDSVRAKVVGEARTRRSRFIAALQLLAYDGQESEQYQRYIWESLDNALGKCDICIRNYYVAKLKFLSDLRNDYEEDDIKNFFGLINRRDISRVKQGLSAATKTLNALPENKRSTAALDPIHLHAIFEGLICEAFLQDEKLVSEYFDEPFRLIQTKKPLRVKEILPATIRFLFDKNTRRLDWAYQTWTRIDRSPSNVEWNWAIKDVVQYRLQTASDSADISRLWSAMKLIVSKLDQQLITHNLFDLIPNICTTAMNHLNKRTPAVPFISQTMKIILDKAPDAFWQAMGSISSQTFIEQVFGSPQFNKSLSESSVAENKDDLDVLSWSTVFLASLKPGNRPAACQTLVNHLFDRIHDQELPPEARLACFESAVTNILLTITSFSDNEKNRDSVERVVLSDILNTISQRIEGLLKPQDAYIIEKLTENTKNAILGIVRNSLALECQNLKTDFESLSIKDSARHESSSYSPDIWNSVIKNLNNDNVKLSSAALLGIMALPGLEQFRIKPSDPATDAKQSYNTIFPKLTGMVGKILERLAEFQPEHLDTLFRQQETSMSLIAALFSADQDTYQAAVDLVKNISGESGRKEALAHLLGAFLGVTVYSLCWAYRRMSNMKTFASVPRMMKTGVEILDVLCNTSNGMLRGYTLEHRDYGAISNYWSYQWVALKTVFRQTEPWSLEIHDKMLMTELCRDTMQYAEALFEQYDVFASVLMKAKPERASTIPKMLLSSDDAAIGSPLKTLDAMSKWLRLRDQYLADTLVKLVTKMLYRLKSHDAVITSDGLDYIQEVATRTSIKTILSDNQKAALVRALEHYYGRQISKPVQKKQSTLRTWTGSATTQQDATSVSSSRAQSIDEFGDSDIPDEEFYELSSKAVEPAKSRFSTKEIEKAKALSLKSQQVQIKKKDPAMLKSVVRQAQDSKAFIENRKREEGARKQRDREAALKLRGKSGVGEQTSGQGSGMAGLGVKGKDHSAGINSLMVSSESESDSDSDDAIFGKVKTIQPTVRGQAGVRKPLPAGPVRKIKQARSHKDMRARLAPDLSPLHNIILAWDFFADTDLPPHSARDDYSLVANTFSSAADYQKTFEPLLILEGWQSFRSAREEGTFKSFQVKVSNSLIVDNFLEVNSQMSMAEGRELRLGVADVVLLSKSKDPGSDSKEPHCLARVKEVTRKKGEVQVVYRLHAPNNTLRAHLNDKATVYGVQILSLTPLEREYGALMALPYYDLCEEIIGAKPSPLLDYTDDELKIFSSVYTVNKAQAKAVKSALDNDAFTLIQGPPGSGKTKTICALVGAMMTGFLNRQGRTGPNLNTGNRSAPALPPASKKVLVCAPSNAAVDELVMRFKQGIKLTDGSAEKVSIVRLGRSDAINANVKDVTLEELVNARLNTAAPKDPKEDIGGVMQEHKATSDALFQIRSKMSEKRSKGQPILPEDEQLESGLKRKQSALSTKIDDLREKQNTASRDAELSRKRIQQEILDSAHVLCATLSGSGHEIFQGLNVEFDTVIIDEAAQSIELSALIPLKYGCTKCILVGDPKQLPPTVLSRQAANFQFEQSLFARMEKNHKKNIHLLDTQYRMHPEISMFPSMAFYDSRLKDGSGMAQLRRRPWHHSEILAPYRFFDVQGMSQAATKGHSLVNIAELNVAMQLYERLITDVRNYKFAGKIGIITPYKGQLKELKSRFMNRYGEDITSTIEFNTTDAFQGRESEIIIFSCVRANTKGIGFLNDIRRMNVGLTRAKCSLWVLGNSESLMQGEFWRGMINDAKSRNLYTDGDVLNLLRRPLLTEEMMKDDVEMTDANSPAASEPDSVLSSRPKEEDNKPSSSHSNTPATSGRSTPVPPRQNSVDMRIKSASPAINDSRPYNSSKPVVPTQLIKAEQTSSRERSLKADLSKQIDKKPTGFENGVYGRSGGRFGLNDGAKCHICGSDDHFTFNCKNVAAKQAQMGNCQRCHRSDHSSTSCETPRCIQCGNVGHKTQSCTAPEEMKLTKQQQESVKHQEAKFAEARQRRKERRIEKQLGEHGAKIPGVKLSEPTVPKPSTSAQKTDGVPVPSKRARPDDNPSAGSAPKAPRLNDAQRADRNGTSAIAAQTLVTREGSHHLQGGNKNNNHTNPPPPPPQAPVASRPEGLPNKPNMGPAAIIRKKKSNTDNLFMKKR